MSSDPLPLPEIWSDLPKGGAYEGTRTEFVANGRSGLVLIEYASGFAQSDPQPVVQPIERAEQLVAGERVPSLAPAALAKGLADLTAIVTQVEALLRAQRILKGDAHFAVERIHDVAMALRMRDVDSTLCDMLDASVREVGDAVVRHEAAATGTLSAAALLRDIMRRIEDLAAVASRMVASGAEPTVRSSGSESEATIEAVAVVTKTEDAIEASAPVVTEAEAAIDRLAPVATEAEAAIQTLSPVASEAGAAIEASAPVASPAEAAIEVRADEFSTGPEAETVDGSKAEAVDTPQASAVNILISDESHTRGLLDTASGNGMVGDDALPGTQAIAEPADDAAVPAESLAAATPPLQDDINVAAEAPDHKDEAASAVVAGEAASAAPVIETASASPAVEADTSTIPATRSEQEPAQVASSPFVGESGSVAATKPRRPANDPLAVLYGLSEEELIALFT
jgi:hypothetical protein